MLDSRSLLLDLGHRAGGQLGTGTRSTQHRYRRVHNTGISGYTVQVHQGTCSSGTVGYKVQILQGAQYRYIRLHSTGTSGYTVQVHQGTRSSGTVGYKVQMQ